MSKTKLFRRSGLAVLGAALLSAGLASCVSVEEPVVEPGAGTEITDTREVVFSISVPASEAAEKADADAGKTRAIQEAGAADNVVNDVLFLMFDEDDVLLAGVDGYRIITTDLTAKAAEGETLKNLYNVKIEIPEAARKALVVANWGAYAGGTTAADYMIPALAGKTATAIAADISLFDYDAFAGNKDFTADHAFHIMASRLFDLPAAGQKAATIQLIRSLAKINVTVSNTLTVAGDSGSGQLTAADGFQMKTIRLMNVHRRSTVTPPSSTTAGAMRLNGTGTITGATDYIEYIVPTAGATSFIDNIFLPETAFSGNPDNFTLTDWKAAPTLLIQARLQQGGANVDRWFRVNLCMTDTADKDKDGNVTELVHTNLLRNHKYSVVITGIGGLGYATPQEAYDALPGDLTIQLIETEIDSDLNHVVYNGQYYIASNGPKFLFTPLPKDGVLKLFTDYPGGWEITKIEGNAGDWLTGADIVVGKTGAAGTKAELAFHMETNNSGTNRTAFITVSAGTLSQKIAIQQEMLMPGVRNTGNDPGVIGYVYNPGKPDHHTLTMLKDNNDDADGIIYVAYFKFGSLIATDTQGENLATNFAADKNIVAWPEEWATDRAAMEAKFDPSTSPAVQWNIIPNAGMVYTFSGSNTGTSFPAVGKEADPVQGVGDPCTYWFGDEWKVPSTVEWRAFVGTASSASNGSLYYVYNGVTGPSATNVAHGEFPMAPNGPILLPAAGRRNFGSAINDRGSIGYYMTSSSSGAMGGFATFGNNQYTTGWTNMLTGNAVRCMHVTPVAATVAAPVWGTAKVTSDVTGTLPITSALAGASVTFTAETPHRGVVLASWTVTKAPAGFSLTAEQKTANPLTITMPDGALTLTAAFEPAPGPILVANSAPGIIGYVFNPGSPDHNTLTMTKDDGNMANGVTFVAHFRFGSMVATSSQVIPGDFVLEDIIAYPQQWAADRAAMEAKFSSFTTPSAKFVGIPVPDQFYVFDDPDFGTLFPSAKFQADPNLAIGDACAYWADELGWGTDWRTPTDVENAAFIGRAGYSANGTAYNGNVYYNYSVTGTASATNPAVGVFPMSPYAPANILPATGFRTHASGSRLYASVVGVLGRYHSSTIGAKGSLFFNSSSADGLTYGDDGSTSDGRLGEAVYAFGLRCVNPAQVGDDVRVGSVIWAGANVDATDPFHYDGIQNMYTFDEATGGNSSDLDASVCPTGWRLPTAQDYYDLFAAATNIDQNNVGGGDLTPNGQGYYGYSTAYALDNKNGVNGVSVETALGSLFFPASGTDWGSGSGYDVSTSEGTEVRFWTSDEHVLDAEAYAMWYGAGSVYPAYQSAPQTFKASVRCVKDVVL